MMRVRSAGLWMAAAMAAVCLAGCSKGGAKTVKLDSNNPVSLTVWHYYNGAQQATFDTMIQEFNATVGKEKGIYVEAYSQGSVSDLEKAIQSSLNQEVGAGDLPDMFSAYADMAYTAQQKGILADLSQYLTKKEQEAYVDSYIDEGYLNNDGALYLLPVAKSTEILMVNQTDWEPFAEATGSTLDELKTTEGITEVAERYYNWTDSLTPDIPDDGKAMYGRDSMSNYFIIGMRQMGKEIFEVKDGKVTYNTDKGLIRRLWDNYYVPYIKGYFAAYGRFRSDDVKTGDVIAYTGSMSSASYFPDHVETDTENYPIDCVIQEAPVMKDGSNVRVQQGAGMAVTKSDDAHEYASSVFLKWFTQKEQNLRFGCNSGYLPVLKAANTTKALDETIASYQIGINDKVYECLKTVLNEFDQTEFYTPKTFEEGYSARKVLDCSLSDRVAADKKAIDAAVADGASREKEIKKYLTDEAFEQWYEEFCSALEQAK